MGSLTLRRLASGVAVLAVVTVSTLAPGGAASAAHGPRASAAPGAKPAAVRVTLRNDFSGTVVSERPGCVDGVTVHLFLRQTETGEVSPQSSTETNRRGAYSFEGFGSGRRVPPAWEYFTLVLGTARCAVAQSRSIAVSRAPRAAARTVSLQNGATSVQGRVRSNRARCVKDAAVLAFVNPDGTDSFFYTGQTTTDDEGRYRFSDGRRTGQQGRDLLTVVVGDPRCRVAQSPTRAIRP